jgi:hypothetical protein
VFRLKLPQAVELAIFAAYVISISLSCEQIALALDISFLLN